MARKKMAVSIRQNARSVSKSTKGFVSKSQTVAVHGPEPVQGNETFQLYMIKFFNWANIMFDSQSLKDTFISYAETLNFNLSQVQGLPAYNFGTLGKLSHLLKQGRDSSYLVDKFDEELFKLLDQIPDTKEEKVTVEEKEADKATQDYWNLYFAIDQLVEKNDVTPESVTKLLSDSKPNIKSTRLLQVHYKENLEDWSKEVGDRAYKRIVNQNIKSHTEIVKQIDSFLINLENTKAAVRKPRKASVKKAKPAAKLVEKLQYMKNDSSLGITSISPESIIGAKALLIFNTKTRKFGIFQSVKESGLTVKGTTILDFDENKSATKTLRKPSDQIPMLTSSTLKRMEIVFKDIKAVSSKIKGRISEDILLLKIFK